MVQRTTNTSLNEKNLPRTAQEITCDAGAPWAAHHSWLEAHRHLSWASPEPAPALEMSPCHLQPHLGTEGSSSFSFTQPLPVDTILQPGMWDGLHTYLYMHSPELLEILLASQLVTDTNILITPTALGINHTHHDFIHTEVHTSSRWIGVVAFIWKTFIKVQTNNI